MTRKTLGLGLMASALLTLPASGLARKQVREWKRGVLISEHRESQTAYINHVMPYEVYVIEGDDGIRYTGSQLLHGARSHGANLIANDPVEFRVGERSLFVRGSHGKVYKCRLDERARMARPAAK
jgi:hypothetical protein